jgi:very-short-patch-repair endonuclease
MPPSNNFGRKEDEDSDEGDMESILDQALAARLPHLRLTGHYRSRHETLIAFSNSHYYDNALTTFPSAETKQSAVTLRRIEGVYAKGRGQNNSIEAQAVVAEVVKRLQGMLDGEPELSIGIVTINSQQQRMVEDFMDEARRKNPELERFFVATDEYDPIFVKNLESVQGDERDIIMLSLTYGPTEQGSRTMSMNFGPLNKQGGERRLNVAITRATSEVIVFSSFDSSMVDLSRTQATAVAHLKNYIEFAERGPVALAEYSSANYGVDHFDSEFEQSVAIELREKGWKVQTQVGVSKFRVDLGIIHPDRPGEYLAGVECDGATYHGSPSARDRDRVRQAILENLGWRIVRFWSTDYFQEQEYALRKLHERLEALLADDRAKADAQPSGNKQSVEVQFKESVTEVDEKIEARPFSEPNLSDVKADDLLSAIPDKIGLDFEPTMVSGSLAEGVLADLPTYNKDKYFHDDHRMNLSRLARLVLERKNGIALHELTLDIARLHGLTRSSLKQRQHLLDLIKNWAGLWQSGEEKTTVWLSPDDVCDEIPWRGLFAFGVERDWKDLCYQEQLGIARAAIAAQPNNPADWMFKELEIVRRHSSTVEEFEAWIDRVRSGKVNNGAEV